MYSELLEVMQFNNKIKWDNRYKCYLFNCKVKYTVDEVIAILDSDTQNKYIYSTVIKYLKNNKHRINKIIKNIGFDIRLSKYQYISALFYMIKAELYCFNKVI